MKQLILASASPRRRELLAQLVHSFDVIPSRYQEEEKGDSAEQTALLFAREKAREVHARFPDRPVLGADTVVSLNGEILGKPVNEEDAKRMLRALSEKEHSVYTGICIICGGRERAETVETKVCCYPLSEETIEKYVQSGLPLDKAGAYGIQDGYPLVKGYAGSYSNVVGLPLERLSTILKEEELC